MFFLVPSKYQVFLLALLLKKKIVFLLAADKILK